MSLVCSAEACGSGIAGRRTVELGAGTGAVGLVAAALGTKKKLLLTVQSFWIGDMGNEYKIELVPDFYV